MVLVNHQPVFHGSEDTWERGIGVKAAYPRRFSLDPPATSQNSSSREKLAFLFVLSRTLFGDGRGTRPNWLSKNKTSVSFERAEGKHRGSKTWSFLDIFSALCREKRATAVFKGRLLTLETSPSSSPPRHDLFFYARLITVQRGRRYIFLDPCIP